MKTKGPYKIIDIKAIYKNPWIELAEHHVVEPNGKEAKYAIINYKPGVSIVALDEDKNIYAVKEYYYAIEEYGIQLPSGGIEKGQTPLETAKKELLEETGFEAKKWTELGFTHPFTMILKSPAYLFLAEGLHKKEEGEVGIKTVKIPLQEAYQMVLDNKITHAQSCIAIMKAKILLDKK